MIWQEILCLKTEQTKIVAMKKVEEEEEENQIQVYLKANLKVKVAVVAMKEEGEGLLEVNLVNLTH